MSRLFTKILIPSTFLCPAIDQSTIMPACITKKGSITIVGAGVFGLATALELARRGYTDIRILDRNLPPVPDGSSVDISRVVRPDYADAFYARMGLDAMKGWNNEYSKFFFPSGLLCVQSQGSTQHEYLAKSRENLQRLGASLNIKMYKGRQASTKYPAIHGDLSHTSGYWNLDSGWADAEKSIEHLARLCTGAGVSFISGRAGTVMELITTKVGSKEQITGVRTADGKSSNADLVILATGAWTPYLIDPGNRFIATGQPVGFIQLTPEEAAEMQGCPVMIDLSTGWFAFPPTTGDHVLKMARHGYGFETAHAHSGRSSSAEFSAPTLATQTEFLPADAERALREGLRLFLPRLQDRPFLKTRLCWYTDTPKGDFIVDYHPDYTNLFLATGGSGQ